MRGENGLPTPAAWHDLIAKLVDRLPAVGRQNPDGVRFLLSAHASHEEMFLFRRLAQELIGEGAVAVTWRVTPKAQPVETTFVVPPVDAPNVSGARLLGLIPTALSDSPAGPDLSALRAAIQAGQISALCVRSRPGRFVGDVRWILTRAPPASSVLVVQGVLMTDLARGADFVLPGASYGERSVLHERPGPPAGGRPRDPGSWKAMEDWQILVKLSAALGMAFDYTSPRTFEPTSPKRSASGSRGLPRLPSRRRSRRAIGCRRATRPSAGSGTSCSRTCRR
jgi:predicted molibdopterin-dependent oxidoreductase YjgC